MTDQPPLIQELRVALPAPELWDLMWRPEGLPRWLGPRACVSLRMHDRCALGDEAGVWRLARIVSMKTGTSVSFSVEPAPAWGPAEATRVTVTVTATTAAGCTVRVEETGLGAAHADDATRYWASRLSRLASLVRQVRDRRSNPRQAVIVIHGVGEQQPGQTLAALAASGVLSSSKGDRMWVKPDHVSGSYELHRLTIEGTAQRPTTDAFELYWAHVIRDTTLGQIGMWLRRLLFRANVPGTLRPAWLAVWAGLLVSAVALTATALGVAPLPAWLTGGALVTAAGLAWRFLIRGLAIDVIGDAARYLTPDPANIAHRQALRSAGVELLQRLHDSGRYDRIVILGHSLGSVIAYDILTHAWAAMHQRHRRPSRPAFGPLAAVERALSERDPAAAATLQAAAWRQQRMNTQPWLVTDLVTVGSPLAHAPFLMAASADAFARAQADRMLPTCPPVAEIEAASKHRRVSFDRPYRDVHTGQPRTFTVLHHAAPFAVTRWTNLYFEVGWLGLRGDLIGGPVAPAFGPWVSDIPLKPRSFTPAHTSYWLALGGANTHLDALRAALRLDARAELEATLAAMPAFAVLPDPRDGDEQ